MTLLMTQAGSIDTHAHTRTRTHTDTQHNATQRSKGSDQVQQELTHAWGAGGRVLLQLLDHNMVHLRKRKGRRASKTSMGGCQKPRHTTHTHTQTDRQTDRHTHTHTHARTYACTHARTRLHACMHARTHTRTLTPTNLPVKCVLYFTYSYSHTHTVKYLRVFTNE